MVDPLSRVFSALADPIRRDMVARLASADATVNELAAPYEVSLQAEVFDLMTKWIERYRREAEERYRRLDDVLRSMPEGESQPTRQEGARP